MATLGKVLLFVNLLMAAGVVYVATDDWARRQAVTAVALQARLGLVGLPLEAKPADNPDAIPFPLQASGGVVVETISPKLLASYFQGADGGTTFGGSGQNPATQLQEVKRVRDKANAILRDATPANRLGKLAGSYDAQGRFLAGWLAVMAESYEERLVVRRLADDGKDPNKLEDAAKKAEDILNRKFDAIEKAPDPKAAAEFAGKVKEAAEAVRANPQDAAALQTLGAVLADAASPAAARDDRDRLRRVAHVLAHLDRDIAWQKRVALTVGLKQYQETVADQATRMRDIARSTQRQIELDQAAFIEQYEQLKNLALERSQLLDQQVQIRLDLTRREKVEDEAVKQRMRQLEDRIASLAEARRQVAKELAAQAQVEKDLFDVQARIGRTLERNFQLEEKLGAVEEQAAKKPGGL